MNQEDRIDELIHGAYDAASTGDWATFLARYMCTFEADGAWISCIDFEKMEVVHVQTVGYTQGFLDEFALYHSGAVDLYGAVLGRVPLAKVHHYHGLVQRSVAERSSFFNEFIVPSGYQLDGNVCVTRKDDHGLEGLCLHYAKDRKESLIPSTHHLQDRVVAHLIAARDLERRMLQLEGDRGDLLLALDSHDCPIIGCDERGLVRLVSRAAREILQLEDGLAYRLGRVTALDSASRSRLELALGRARQLCGRQAQDLPQLVEVTRRSGASPYKVAVSPVPEALAQLPGQACRLLLFIEDPARRLVPDEALLQRRFSLSQQEARVALLLVQGHSPAEVALLLFVSRETVKSHTKSIYMKTNTHSHAELCVLLLNGLGRLRRVSSPLHRS